MESELVKLIEFSGQVTSIYSVCYNENENTMFDEFRARYYNLSKYKKQMGVTTLHLKQIAEIWGAKDQFFEPNDPIPADKVCYIILNFWPRVRLFCIRFSEKLVIIGSGNVIEIGKKANESKQLINQEKSKIMHIAELISTQIQLGELKITQDGKDFVGKLML